MAAEPRNCEEKEEGQATEIVNLYISSSTTPMKRIPAIIIIALSNRPLMAIAIVDHGMAALGWASLSFITWPLLLHQSEPGGGTSQEWCVSRGAFSNRSSLEGCFYGREEYGVCV
jgi:hypothetical protein